MASQEETGPVDESRATLSARRAHSWVAVVAVSIALASCATSSSPADDTALGDDAITVGSFNFGESQLLAEIYAQALEQRGFTIERELDLGPRELVSPALSTGLVELVPEYSGTALQFLTLGSAPEAADADVTHRALVRAAVQRNLIALDPAPAQNQNVFAMTRAKARRLGVETLSDLDPVAGDLVFGGPPECRTRPLCLDGLKREYGLEFREFVALDAGGPITRQALEDGHVDIALLFGTDPALDGERFVALVDDRSLQPAENVTPLVRGDVVQRWGSAVTDVLDRVSHELTTEELRALNETMVAGRATPADLAARWLERHPVR